MTLTHYHPSWHKAVLWENRSCFRIKVTVKRKSYCYWTWGPDGWWGRWPGCGGTTFHVQSAQPSPPTCTAGCVFLQAPCWAGLPGHTPSRGTGWAPPDTPPAEPWCWDDWAWRRAWPPDARSPGSALGLHRGRDGLPSQQPPSPATQHGRPFQSHPPRWFPPRSAPRSWSPGLRREQYSQKTHLFPLFLNFYSLYMLDLSHTLVWSEPVWILTVIKNKVIWSNVCPNYSLTEVPPHTADEACGMLKLHL